VKTATSVRVSSQRVNLSEHPAARAWARFAGSKSSPSDIAALKQSSHTAVYRLDGIGPGTSSVCAKHSDREALAPEKAAYEALALLPLPVLCCYGLMPDEDPGKAWLFVEDAGENVYSAGNREDEFAFTRWLAFVHASFSGRSVDGVPEGGPLRYLESLRQGRQRIIGNLSNPALCEAQVAILGEIVDRASVIEAHWSQIDEFCASLPKTLVHGDIAPKNVRFRGLGPNREVLVLDWETVGWGVPAADIARHIDLHTYGSFAKQFGLEGPASDLKHLARCGSIFRILAAIDWDSRWLSSEWIERPMRHMRSYNNYLAEFTRDLACDG
jgi:hypothetical protein